MLLFNKFKNQPPTVQGLLVLVSLVPLYYVSYRYRLQHPYSLAVSKDHSALPTVDFVREWLKVQVIAPFDPYPIASYCDRTTWQPNLVFQLATANGGIGNIRGNFLDFVFFALEAGAAIILPKMASRDPENISNVWAPRISFDTFFDEEWFVFSLNQACPQMMVYKPLDNQSMVDALPGIYLPVSRRLDEDGQNTRERFVGHVAWWLENNEAYHADQLTLVNLERTLFEIDTRTLMPGFRRNFGSLLRINANIRRLAAIVVENLKNKYNLTLDPRDTIPRGAFYGAHLRTEADAVNAGWLSDDEGNLNFSAQTDAFIVDALKHKLQIIYVASGYANHTAMFAAKAATSRPPLTVITKRDLLPPNHFESSADLAGLTWDQQALIDYEVLMRCSVFSGVSRSSFAWNIALARHEWLEGQGRVTEPWYVVHKEPMVFFDDGLSRMLGRYEWHEKRVPRGMWP